jgi:hypothetical protein
MALWKVVFIFDIGNQSSCGICRSDWLETGSKVSCKSYGSVQRVDGKRMKSGKECLLEGAR